MQESEEIQDVDRQQSEEAGARVEDPREPVIQITEQDLQAEAGLYYLLEHGAPADQPVETTIARGVLDASEIFLLPEIAASISIPPYRNGQPSQPNAPPVRAAVTEDGQGYLIGRADWPEDDVRTHGEMWSTFNQQEIRYLREVWEHLRTDPAESPATPYPEDVR